MRSTILCPIFEPCLYPKSGFTGVEIGIVDGWPVPRFSEYFVFNKCFFVFLVIFGSFFYDFYFVGIFLAGLRSDVKAFRWHRFCPVSLVDESSDG
ncbi:hypothetical protein H9C73_09385 [Marinobacterium sp. AK62]|uniref:Transmembrane protein n=1 Tax=Marinobacterium alkalitolerans TaxID=1542925 RepID=A0ABS3ZB72_9GAMM|nr:hypothetical protein [Marinobacterium alkalitolerans]MBP0048950.1 hypothetical protein [Marinobacterium alkalitolerans]